MTQMAMTQNFVWITTDDTESDYLEYKQWDSEKEKIIKVSMSDMEFFEWTLFKWYHWITLACKTKWVYDLYRVYQDWKFMLESEDEVMELPSWIDLDKPITIKVYERLWEDRLLLLWESYKKVNLPSRDKSDSYKLSVVVPCYKASLFMSRTIDSILSSTLDSIEVIIVNDGSPENDLEIANWYADNYWCVKVIDKPNTWLCDTRNRWMDIATWEYLAFCDADDIIHPFMYEKLYNACKKNNTDIAISSILIRNQPNVKEWSLKLDHDLVYTFEEMMQHKDTKENIYFVWVWNKIVKTATARIVRFPTEYIGKSFVYEDIAYTWSLYSYIEKFSYCHDAIYTWEKRKRQTVWTVSTWHREWDSVEHSWNTFIFWASYPLYHKSWNHVEWHDFVHFKRIIEAYKKFQSPCPIRNYFDQKLRELIISQKLKDNKLIMADKDLSTIVNRLWNA